MKSKRATLEVIAPTVEEAVAKGLEDLGLPAEAVEVEVLDQGSRGLFGIGSRHARIRLAVKGALREQQPDVLPDAGSPPDMREQREEAPPRPAVEPEPAEPSEERAAYPESPVTASQVRPSDHEMDEQDEVRVARETVRELLEKMRVTAEVSARLGEMDQERGRLPILVDVNGDDLSILIGRRAETLNALQYIATLIISKELGRSVSVIIDVEGYRSRREGQIRQLARRMADQAVKTGRRQVLEPMPASERRIIHIELREHPDVSTESVGEEPRRKVTIIPKS
jgi:spoIIIJ-associated protein